MPEVSVIIPTYNRANMISKTVQSVLDQTFTDIELIIVDDGSTDNTEEVLKRWNDRRIKVIRHRENKGAPAARNTGIKNAGGLFIAFLDSDNEWLPKKLEKQVSLFRDLPQSIGVVYAVNKVVDEVKNEVSYWDFNLRGNLYRNFLKGPFLDFITPLIRKECFDRIGFMDVNVLAYQEWDTFLRISKYYEFDFVPEILAVYYRHKGETISKSSVKAAKGYSYIIEKHRDDIIRNAGRRAFSAHYGILFFYYREAKDYINACRAFFLFFSCYPKNIVLTPIYMCIKLLTMCVNLLSKIRDVLINEEDY